jgi:FkbM family methyltransferase
MKQSSKRILHNTFDTANHCDAPEVLQCCIAYNKYGGYCLPLSSIHRPAPRKILSGQVYEPRTIEFLMSHCGNGDIVHAGTYFGDFLPALSKSIARQAKVWAFEPNFENYRCASITMCVNEIKNVELMHAGLGEKSHSHIIVTADINGCALGGGSQVLIEGYTNISLRTEDVQIVALDEIIPSNRQVSIIQLDVEGYEKHVLSGALKIIQRCRPIIILEYLPDEKWLFDNILSLGYRVRRKIHSNRVLAID